MKIPSLVVAAFAVAALPAFGQIQQSTVDRSAEKALDPRLISAQSSVIERGPNHRVWQTIRSYATPIGQTVTRTTSYTEVASGLNFQRGGEWLDSDETISIQQDGIAASLNGAHQARFSANINSAEPVVVGMADGKTLKAHILGIAYYDFKLKQSVLVASLKDCIGEVVGRNQVLYPDAFDGVTADVRYSNTKEGLEQDVIVRTAPPSPQLYGFDPRMTWIEVWTEFINPPQPAVRQQVRKGWARAKVDRLIDFGAMQIGSGTAFGIGTVPDKHKGFAVQKHWTTTPEGRVFLIEEIPYWRCRTKLNALPEQPQAAVKNPASKSNVGIVSNERLWPTRNLAKIKRQEKFLVASLSSQNEPGFVVDYALVQSTNDFTFKADTTYYVSGSISLSGTTTIEGNTVIKYDTNAVLNVLGNIVCQTAPYRPAILTSCNDNSVGESISSDDLHATDRYADTVLNLQTGGDLKYLHVRYAQTAFLSSTNYTVSHCQFMHCDKAIEADQTSCWLKNVLMSDVSTGFWGHDYTITAEHLTFDNGNLVEDWTYDLSLCDGTSTDVINLTNSLLTAVANNGLVPLNYGADTVFSLSNTGFYDSTGGGGYYLVPNSALRDIGTTNISPDLLVALAGKTTYPPVVYSNAIISLPTTLRPTAERDKTAPDIGYHYDPLDFAFGGTIANANLTITPGTAVGWFRTSSGWYHAGHGINLTNKAVASFTGKVDAPDYWVRCNTVQEESTGQWSGGYGPGGITGRADQYAEDPTQASEAQLTFTRCSTMATESGNHFRDDWGYLNLRASNSEFYGGLLGGYALGWYMTNCFLDRVDLSVNQGWPGNECISRNCTWHGGNFYVNRNNGYAGANGGLIPVSVRDDAFDGTSIYTADAYATNGAYSDFAHNAFLIGAATTYPTNTSDVPVSNFNWQTSWLGSYYLPTNSLLIDAGSQNATNAGLYHFTTQVTQTKESTSPVDIGYHYVAVDGSENPIDSDGDKIPDYLEDSNGNGIFDGAETDWQTYTSQFGLGQNGLNVFTPLK